MIRPQGADPHTTSELVALAVMAVTVLVTGIGALWLVSTEGDRQTEFLLRRDRLRWVAEAVLDMAMNRLEKVPWSARYYAAIGQESREVGSYEGNTFHLLVSDVPDGKGASPGRTDLVVQVAAEGEVLQLVARLAYRNPSPYRPRPWAILWIGETDPAQMVGLPDAPVRAMLDELETKRKESRALTRVVERTTADVLKGKPGTQPVELLTVYPAQNLKDRAAQELRFLQAFDEAAAYYLGGGGQPPDPFQATGSFEQAQDIASNMTTPLDRSADTAESLLARARSQEWCAEAPPPGKAGGPWSRESHLKSAQTMLADILRLDPPTRLIPEGLYELARTEFMLRSNSEGIREAQAWLDRLASEFPRYRLWEAEWPSSSSDDANLARYLRGTMSHRLHLLSDSGSQDLWAADERSAIPLTRLSALLDQPAEGSRDLAGLSPDGARLAFRVRWREGAGGERRAVTLDYDGGRVREVTASSKTPGWKPLWMTDDKVEPPATYPGISIEQLRKDGPEKLLPPSYRAMLETLHAKLKKAAEASPDLDVLVEDVATAIGKSMSGPQRILDFPATASKLPGGPALDRAVHVANVISIKLSKEPMTPKIAQQLLEKVCEARQFLDGVYAPVTGAAGEKP